MNIFKLIGMLLSTCCAIQYFYWAALEIGWGLSMTAEPKVSHDWLFFAFGTAGFWMAERVFQSWKSE